MSWFLLKSFCFDYRTLNENGFICGWNPILLLGLFGLGHFMHFLWSDVYPITKRSGINVLWRIRAPRPLELIAATQSMLVFIPELMLITSVTSHFLTGCLHRTWAAWQNTIEPIIISDAVYTGCDATRQIPTVNWCRVLFMMCWHKVLMIFNRRFVASSVDTVCQHSLSVT